MILRTLVHRHLLLTVLAVHVVLRLVSGVMLHRAVPLSRARPAPGQWPDYVGLMMRWDGGWYEKIAAHGYPVPPPVAAGGGLAQSEWAFLPLFPVTTRWLVQLTGRPFPEVASMWALVLSCVAVVLVARLVRSAAGPWAALAAAVLLSAHPVSPVLQTAYTESAAVLVVALTLLGLVERRWWLAALGALLAGLTRPVALPLAAVGLVAVVARWRRRHAEPLRPAELVGMAGALVACGVSGLLWPAWGALRTGIPTLYTQTQSAWRGGVEVVPFRPWLDLAERWGPTGLLVLLLGIVAVPVVALGPWARGLGPVLRAWLIAYPAYLLAVVDPWTSVYRFTILLLPLGAVLAGLAWAPRPATPPRAVVSAGGAEDTSSGPGDGSGARVLGARTYRGPAWLPWVLGLGLLALCLWGQWVWVREIVVWAPPGDFFPP